MNHTLHVVHFYRIYEKTPQVLRIRMLVELAQIILWNYCSKSVKYTTVSSIMKKPMTFFQMTRYRKNLLWSNLYLCRRSYFIGINLIFHGDKSISYFPVVYHIDLWKIKWTEFLKIVSTIFMSIERIFIVFSELLYELAIYQSINLEPKA